MCTLTNTHKGDTFHHDIFPPAPSLEPSLSASEFFNGKTAPQKLVSLDDGTITSGAAPSAVPAPSQPTKTFSTAAPVPDASPISPVVSSAVEPPAPTYTRPIEARSSTPPSQSQAIDSSVVRPCLLLVENGLLTLLRWMSLKPKTRTSRRSYGRRGRRSGISSCRSRPCAPTQRRLLKHFWESNCKYLAGLLDQINFWNDTCFFCSR